MNDQKLFFELSKTKSIDEIDESIPITTRLYFPYKIEISPTIGIVYGSKNPEEYIDYFSEIINELNIGCVISLIEPKEEYKHNVPKICDQFNVRYINFSIPDRMPPNVEQVIQVRQLIIDFHKINKNVLIHCTMGRGRTITMIKMIGALEHKDVDVIGQIARQLNCDPIDIPIMYAPSTNIIQENAIFDLNNAKTILSANGEIAMSGGFYDKYMKYKRKYLRLKRKF